MGKAFPLEQGGGIVLGTLSPEGNTVLKEWHTTPEGRTFLIESVAWADIQGDLKKLPLAKRDENFDPPAPDVLMARSNLFLTYITDDLDPGPAYLRKLVLAISTDGGSSFSEVSTFDVSNTNQGALDRPVVATGPSVGSTGTVWVFHQNGNGSTTWLELRGAEVTGLGVVGTFTLDTAPTSNNSSPTDVAVGPNGQVIVSYQSKHTQFGSFVRTAVDPDGLGPNPLATFVEFDNNIPFGFLIPAQDPREITAGPSVEWDRHTNSPFYNRVYLIYTDRNTTAEGDKDTDIYLKYSDDAGATWSSRLRLNSDTSGKSQFFPAVTVDQATGNAAVCWYDARQDPGNILTHVYAAVSTDGFSAAAPRNFQVNPTGSNGTIGNVINYGDYLGLAFHKGRFYPSWCSYVNSSDGGGDMHAAKIEW